MVQFAQQHTLWSVLVLWCSFASTTSSLLTNYTIDEARRGRQFLGYGVNPSAGTYRLLHDYPEPQRSAASRNRNSQPQSPTSPLRCAVRSELLDFMFLPSFGASFHRIKVEIGGDGQGTDGSEPSHMRYSDPRSANFSRGYAWWLLAEAKKRNPQIETYALAESWPRWVHGNNSLSTGPLDAPKLSALYITTWVKGARDAHNVTIDWVGMWNEHWEADSVMFAYATELRAQLDAAGLQGTRIIGPDAFSDAAASLAAKVISDPEGVGKAIGAIGIHGDPVADSHHPNASAAWRCGLPLFASEDGSTYGDIPGALQRVNNIHSEHIDHLSQGSNFWNPWAGYYPVRTPIWAAAHMNQHTAIGMSFLQAGSGVGRLTSGCGTMISYVSEDGNDVTIVIERDFLVSPQYNPATDNRTSQNCVEEMSVFQMEGKLGFLKKLAVWLTVMNANATVANLYERQADITVEHDGSFMLTLPVNSIITITSLLNKGLHGTHPTPPEPTRFPLPYSEDFEGYPKESSNIARYFSDMSGGFEVMNGVLQQRTPEIPIGWFGLTADTMPYTIIGAIDWRDITVAADISLFKARTGISSSIGWIAVRLSQTAEECDGPGVICSNPWGLFAVLDDIGELRLHLRLKQLTDRHADSCVFKAAVSISADGWSRLELKVQGNMATLSMNGEVIASELDVSGPKTAPGSTKSYLPQAGFAALGGGPDYSTDLSFDNFTVGPSSGSTRSGSICSRAPSAGMTVVGVPCGLDVPGLSFDIETAANGHQRIKPRLDHTLCITTLAGSAAAGLTLEKCNETADPRQDFVYNRSQAIVSSAVTAPVNPSPWQGFTPGQGKPYGKHFTAGDVVTAIRHFSINHAAPFNKEESLEFLVNNVSQGNLTMPLLLPEDTVGCVGVCVINAGSETTTIAPLASTAFASTGSSHGAHVAIGADGKTATWTSASCNEVALLENSNQSYSLKISGDAQFVDFGWCSPSLNPAASWPSSSAAGWMGEQGVDKDWIYRSSGYFKASDEPNRDNHKFCLATVESTDRGQVRPWEPATFSSCSAGCSDSSWVPSCGGSVFFDTELGLLRTAADTTGLCFGVCE